MKLKNTRLGFTLIELLVVITIIGILATGAVSVYTSQIQKARDSVRLTDIKTVQGGIEQFYQDDGEYPTATTFSGITAYVPKLPQDPKSGNASANSVFDYMYNVSADSNTIPNQEFEVSTHFEQQGNITGKAKRDGGNDDFRLEQGINLSDTEHLTIVSFPSGIPTSISVYDCVSPTGVADTCSSSNPMIIRNQ